MRAKMKRRQRYRRITILAVVAGILVLLIVGFYFALTASTANDRLIGKPVTSADLARLQQLSQAPYGPSGTSLLKDVKNYSGASFTANGKPLVVYIGADYCPYCAIQRWSIVLALMRFGNFSNLLYMASSPGEGDLVTFTFSHMTYTSPYVAFQGFENLDRNNQPLQTVPSNYSAVWSQYGSEFPFTDFGNRYIAPASMLLFDQLQNKNWTQVMSGISAGDALGTQIKESANVITALICKLTNNQPGSVCNQSPINGLTISIASYNPASFGITVQAGAPALSASPWATVPVRILRA